MSEEGLTASWFCRACGRENGRPAPRCWFCSAPRPGASEIAAELGPARRPAAEPDEDYRDLLWVSSFHRRLPAVTAFFLIILCLLLTLAYGLGLVLLLALAPALYRLNRIGGERVSDSTPPLYQTGGQTCAVAATATAIAALVALSSLITFVAVCGPTGSYAIFDLQGEGSAVQVAVWLAGALGGLLAAGGVSHGILALIFRRKRGETRPVSPPDQGGGR